MPWTARRSNQSILKEISPEYGAAGLYPGDASHLDLASIHPGHVCSSPGSDEQCAVAPSLPHSRSAHEEQQQEVD